MSTGNMSGGNGPVRRRRIAGESTPAVEPTESRRGIVPKPSKKSPAKKSPAAKAPVVKEPSKKSSVKAPVTKSPVKKASPAATATSGDETAEVPVAKPAKPAAPAGPITEVETAGDRRRLIPLAVLALAAVVFGAFFAVKGIGDYRDQQGIGDSNDAASSAASNAAETIFSYDYTTLPEHATKSKALMTPSFQKQFNTINSELTTLATQTKAVILSQARNAAALPCGDQCSPNKASILVFIDQAKQNIDLKTPTVYANRMVVDMVKRNGAWLVNDIQAL